MWRLAIEKITSLAPLPLDFDDETFDVLNGSIFLCVGTNISYSG